MNKVKLRAERESAKQYPNIKEAIEKARRLTKADYEIIIMPAQTEQYEGARHYEKVHS